MRKCDSSLIVIVSIVALCIGVTSSVAVDIGDPVYQQDVSGKKGRVEILYEKYDRDTNLEIGEITFTGPGGTVTVLADDTTTSTDADVFMLRATLLSSESVAIYGDVGILEEDGVDDTALLVGGESEF